MHIRRVVVAALVCFGAGVLSTGVASAATLVLSDKINMAGPLNSTGGWTAARCVLTSDAERTAFRCQGNGTLTRNATGRPTGGTATVVSGDGQTQWNFTLGPPSSTGVFKMTGKGTEQDAPDTPGTPPPPPYPAVMTGTVKITGTTITINAIVKELSTQP
jgi:hypothetical protein